MGDQGEIDASHSRQHWPEYARCADPLCAPNPVCDDYIRGRLVAEPDFYVECMRQGCAASTPDVKTMEAAKAAWDAMIAGLAPVPPRSPSSNDAARPASRGTSPATTPTASRDPN